MNSNKEQQIASLVTCCAVVAKLYRRHGGPFVLMAANAGAKPGMPATMPRRGHQIKRRLKGIA